MDGRVDVLVAAVGELGMSISRSAAAQLIEQRVQRVADQMSMTPSNARRYFTDDTLGSIARTMVSAFAEETPGADVLEAPRTAGLPVPMLGRALAGLAEGIQVRLRERADVEHLRVTVGQLAQTVSALGQLAAEPPTTTDRSTDGVVLLPPGLLHRAARYLEACAQLVKDEHIVPEGIPAAHADQLAATFDRDAAGLRYYASD